MQIHFLKMSSECSCEFDLHSFLPFFFGKPALFSLFLLWNLFDFSVSAFSQEGTFSQTFINCVKVSVFFVGFFHVVRSLTLDKWESLAMACSLSLSIVSYSWLCSFWSINQMIITLVVLGISLTITGQFLSCYWWGFFSP